MFVYYMYHYLPIVFSWFLVFYLLCAFSPVSPCLLSAPHLPYICIFTPALFPEFTLANELLASPLSSHLFSIPS